MKFLSNRKKNERTKYCTMVRSLFDKKRQRIIFRGLFSHSRLLKNL